MMKNETDLRRFYKDVFRGISGQGEALVWVEPGQGASVGAPDLFHGRSSGFVPVEFKFFKKGQKVKFRPQQVAFHKMQSLQERKTICVCGFETGNEKVPVDILIFKGAYIESVLGLDYKSAYEHKRVCSCLVGSYLKDETSFNFVFQVAMEMYLDS